MQSDTTSLSETLFDFIVSDEVAMTAINIPYSFTSYSPLHETSTERELPIDMKFNDGHRVAIVLYSLLMILSALGNIYVFSSIVRLRSKGRRTRINLFQLHLAIADLLVTFLMMPLEIGWNATVSWDAGDAMCRIMSFFRIFGLYLSGFLIMCISLDCYFAIVKPLGMATANRRAKLMLILAWVGSFLCSLPQPAIFHVENHPEFKWYEQCVTFNSFSSPKVELAYNFFGFVLLYLLPLVMIIICYSCILIKIYRIHSRQQNDLELRRSNMGALGRAKIRTLKMTLIIVTTFFLCWTPYNFMSFWYWFDKASALEVDQRIQKGLFLFACTNSCANPLIYGLFHFHRRQNPAPVLPPPVADDFRNPLVLRRNARFIRRNQCCVMECESESSRNMPGVSSSSNKDNQIELQPIQNDRFGGGLERHGVLNLSDPGPRRSEGLVSIRLAHSDSPCQGFESEV